MLEQKDIIPMDVTGSLVMANYGVCRHTTDFLSHIYEHLYYNSSQLFTYRPRLEITIDNNRKTFLTNYDAQKLVELITKDLDFFSTKEIHISDTIDGYPVTLDYEPLEFEIPVPENFMSNHTVNIVESEDGTMHILDTRYHSIGIASTDNKIILDNLGLQHIEFIQDVEYNTYYDTNYYKGIEMAKVKNTNLDTDRLASIVARYECQKYRNYYEQFWRRNKKYFKKVNENYAKLVREFK